MYKQSFITILLTVLISMTGAKAFAHDIEVVNTDGVTIYYVWTNNNTELAVSYQGSHYYSYRGYSGNVVIPESVVYQGNTYSVTSIVDFAFYECSGLTSVTIPNSVISIGSYAFCMCGGLTSITIPNSVTSIGNQAFQQCSSLTSVIIPNSVITIGGCAFFGCSGLTSITISNGVISIGDDAFSGCSGLTSVTIPNSVTSIGSSTFSSCIGLTSVTIPNSVTSIGSNAFSGCSGLTSITIPNSVTSIDSYAFSGCSGLTSVTIPSSVISIGGYAFYSCSDLTSAVIGSGVTSIGNYAFMNTNLKKTIWLTNTPPSGYNNASGMVNYVSNDQFSSLSNIVKYQFLSSYFDVDGIRYVPVSPSERTCDAIDCVYNESATNTKIASSVAYKGVNMMVKSIKPYLAYNNKYIKTLTLDNDGELANDAFAYCSNMTSATLGQKVSAIGSNAFQGCSSVETIDIPDIVTVLNDYTFSGCTSLKDIKIKPNMTDIKNYAFNNCTSLAKVIIEDSDNELNLVSNGSNPLFSSCPLDTVYIGRNINYNTGSSYGYSPFYRNTSLRAVKITDKETEISANEFYGCTNLERVTIGDGITTIGNWAFSGCQSLKYFAFGSKVTTIGQEAFSDCASVTEIISKAAVPPVCGNQALNDINKWDCKLYVPNGCMAAYEAVDQWKDFFFKEEGEGTAEQNPEGQPETGKCKKPKITIVDGKIQFSCATKGVSYTYKISVSEPSGVGNNVIPSSLILTVYASKPGYEDSDVASKEIDINTGIRGDLNYDGSVNVADHVELSKIILNQNK